jgi:hypothetical protein
MTDEEKRRMDDILVIQLKQKFEDFIERYDRDQGALNEWRRTTETELNEQGEILRSMKPAYNGGKWIVGLIMVGSIGLAVKAFWSHLTWR